MSSFAKFFPEANTNTDTGCQSQHLMSVSVIYASVIYASEAFPSYFVPDSPVPDLINAPMSVQSPVPD